MNIEYKHSLRPITVGKGNGSAVNRDARTASGWITTFGPPADHGNDIIDEHALDRYFEERGFLLPMLSGHHVDQLIGRHQLEKVPGQGVRTTMEFFEGIQRADEDLIRVQSGQMNLSIGFVANREEFRNGQRWLLDIELLEASVVLLPMNPRAVIDQPAGKADTAALLTSLRKLSADMRKFNATVREKEKNTDPLQRFENGLRRLTQQFGK